VEENSETGVRLDGQEMGDCRLCPLKDLGASNVKFGFCYQGVIINFSGSAVHVYEVS
jgi:hypothetical protein